jgi:hypothetical protein
MRSRMMGIQCHADPWLYIVAKDIGCTLSRQMSGTHCRDKGMAPASVAGLLHHRIGFGRMAFRPRVRSWKGRSRGLGTGCLGARGFRGGRVRRRRRRIGPTGRGSIVRVGIWGVAHGHEDMGGPGRVGGIAGTGRGRVVTAGCRGIVAAGRGSVIAHGCRDIKAARSRHGPGGGVP